MPPVFGKQVALGCWGIVVFVTLLIAVVNHYFHRVLIVLWLTLLTVNLAVNGNLICECVVSVMCWLELESLGWTDEQVISYEGEYVTGPLSILNRDRVPPLHISRYWHANVERC